MAHHTGMPEPPLRLNLALALVQWQHFLFYCHGEQMAVPGMEQWDPGLFAFPRTQPTSQCTSPSASRSSWPSVTEDDPYDVT